MTDPRAVALVRFEMPKRECCTTTLRPDPQGQWVLYAEVESALADARRRAFEEAAKIADDYPQRDPAEDGNGYWAAQEIAQSIRAKVQAGEEG